MLIILLKLQNILNLQQRLQETATFTNSQNQSFKF